MNKDDYVLMSCDLLLKVSKLSDSEKHLELLIRKAERRHRITTILCHFYFLSILSGMTAYLVFNFTGACLK